MEFLHAVGDFFTRGGFESAITHVIAISAILANFVAPGTVVGKVVHTVALNGPAIQAAAEALHEKQAGK